MKNSKNEKRKEFLKRLEQKKLEEQRIVKGDKDTTSSKANLEEPSVIATRSLLKELRGKLGKSDTEETR